MRWVGHVARFGGEEHTGFWSGNLKERDHFKDPEVDWRKILRWIFRKWYGRWRGMDWIDLA